MALRKTLIAKIYEAIERSPHTAADFSFDFNPGGSKHCSIQFLHHEGFRFVAESRQTTPALAIAMVMPREKPESYLVSIEAPGEHETPEVFRLHSLDQVPERVYQWTLHLRDELRATIPIYSDLAELRERVENHIKEHVSQPEAPFTKAEADEWREKLDTLVKRCEELEDQGQMTQQEIDRLNKEVENLKDNIEKYPKGIWLKTTATRLATIGEKMVTSNSATKLLFGKWLPKLLGLPSED